MSDDAGLANPPAPSPFVPPGAAAVDSPAVDPRLDRRVDEQELSVSTSALLARARVHTLRELVALTEIDLLRTRHVTRRSLAELKAIPSFGMRPDGSAR